MKVGVILYVNRSGSTLFSRMLSDHANGVFVFPELGFPLTLLIERDAGRRIVGEALAALIRADPRSAAIGLADADWARVVAGHSSDDVQALLVDIATAALGRRPVAIVIKLESLAYLIDAIRRAFADTTFFHVIRDPRAVVGSMLRTPVPEKPGFDMARGSIVYAARHWCAYIARVRRIARAQPVTEIRYEALRSSQDPVGQAAAALGVGPAADRDATDARYRTAPIDAALHRRIHGQFNADRLAGWREELSPGAIRTIEAICWDEMIATGYAPLFPRTHRFGATLLAARLSHGRAMIRHVVVTTVRYAQRPGGMTDLRRRVTLAMTARRR